MLKKRGKKETAKAILAEIYGWVTEGFDTADLKEAKRLLEELGKSQPNLRSGENTGRVSSKDLQNTPRDDLNT